MEGNLTDSHVTLFLAYKLCHPGALIIPQLVRTLRLSAGVYMIVRLSFLFPAISRDQDEKGRSERILALDRVCLDQLSAVCQKGLRYRLPSHAFWHAKVYVSRRELVDVEPDILGPCIFDQILV